MAKNIKLSISSFAQVLSFTFAISWGSAASARVQNDIVFDLDSSSGLATFEVGGQSDATPLTGGRVSLESEPVSCTHLPCTVVVNSILVTLAGVDVSTNYGLYHMDDPYALITGPITVVNTGGGYWIPQGTPVTVASNMSGPSIDSGWRQQVRGLPQPLELELFIDPDSFLVSGVFDFTFDVGGNPVSASATAWFSGVTPALNTAPSVVSFADRNLVCQGQNALDGSAALDRENNIISYEWVVDSYHRYWGEQTDAWIGNGAHTVHLGVADVWDGYDETTFTVTVDEKPPSFTTLPVDIVSEQCGAINLGSVVATSKCGDVTLTNDAPATFMAGMTVVTWRAVSPSGLVQTATQKVWVSPGNSRACCPAGSNVIVGTSNNDVLNGTAGVDCIIGLGGQDTINGLGGDDIISAGDGDDVVHGGTGNDIIFGGSGQDVLYGDQQNDGLFGGDGDDNCYGNDGNDTLYGGAGQDQLVCGTGNDSAFGNAGDDYLAGEDGDDYLEGGPNNNRLVGGAGSNVCIWGPNDQVSQCTVPATTPGPSPGYNVCSPKPMKCADCSTLATQCQASSDCVAIIECVAGLSTCNLPNECPTQCEVDRSAAAVQIAGNLASCFGGF